MQDFDIESGGKKYRVSAENEQEARNAVGEREAGDAMVGLFGLLIKIAMLIPTIISWLIGLIVGGLLKLGIVGRVLLTALFAVVVIFVVAVPLQPFITMTEGAFFEVLFSVLLLAPAAAAAVWFYAKHYRVLKALPALTLAQHTKICGSILFWGIVAMGVISQLIGGGGLHDGVIIFVPLTAAWILWLVKTNERRSIMLITAGAVVVLCIAESVGYGMRRAEREAVRKAELEKLIEEKPHMAILLLEPPFEATVTAEIKTIRAGSPNEEIILPAGARITVTSYTNLNSVENCYASATYVKELDRSASGSRRIATYKELIISDLSLIRPVQ